MSTASALRSPTTKAASSRISGASSSPSRTTARWRQGRRPAPPHNRSGLLDCREEPAAGGHPAESPELCDLARTGPDDAPAVVLLRHVVDGAAHCQGRVVAVALAPGP